MSKNEITQTFRWRHKSSGLPWLKVTRELGAVQCSRTTNNHPTWNKIVGNGFTIYLSDINIATARQKPPEWELIVQSLALLPPAGKETWNLVISTIEAYLDDLQIEYIKF